MMMAIQRAKEKEERAKAAEETEYFDWLELNIPELFNIQGRPHWIEFSGHYEQRQSVAR